MKITFAPSNYSPRGVVSFCSWENADFKKAIRQCFNESPREQIVEIVIERDGMKAIFEPRNVPGGTRQ